MTEPALPLLERAGDVAFGRAALSGAQVLQHYRDRLGLGALRDVVVPFTTDLMFRIPSIRLAEAAHTHNPRTYMFCFGWKGRMGAVHALSRSRTDKYSRRTASSKISRMCARWPRRALGFS